MTKEEAISIISGYEAYGCGYCLQGGEEVEEALRLAVDALRQEIVIRCKDCKLWMKNPYRESSVFGLCFKHKDIAIATDETDWCSWAERKADADS